MVSPETEAEIIRAVGDGWTYKGPYNGKSFVDFDFTGSDPTIGLTVSAWRLPSITAVDIILTLKGKIGFKWKIPQSSIPISKAAELMSQAKLIDGNYIIPASIIDEINDDD